MHDTRIVAWLIILGRQPMTVTDLLCELPIPDTKNVFLALLNLLIDGRSD
jgi:hypothetical protein